MTAAALATTLTATTTTLAAAAPAALTAAPATLTATRGAGAERGVAFPGTLSREAEIIDLVHASLRVMHPDQPAFFGPGHIVRFQQLTVDLAADRGRNPDLIRRDDERWKQARAAYN